jgi:glycosyltransferase involved in cell wall biosynthesis
MLIWAHTLFRNEERWLWYSVTSVINHVDKLLLWDTGSSDKSWEIAKLLKKKYPEKIDLRQYGEVTSETFASARQEMLDATNSDWFIVVDADEIWWEDSIANVVAQLRQGYVGSAETLIVPTVNLVGDTYHHQSKEAGKYKFGNMVGHYNLRAVKRSIPGLHSLGSHGVWGWADGNGNQIQDRNTFKFIDSPYLHASFLQRAGGDDDKYVPKRQKKLKYEIGKKLPLGYYYPEVFFEYRPDFIESPWEAMGGYFKLRAYIETPLKLIKRRLINDRRVGY